MRINLKDMTHIQIIANQNEFLIFESFLRHKLNLLQSIRIDEIALKFNPKDLINSWDITWTAMKVNASIGIRIFLIGVIVLQIFTLSPRGQAYLPKMKIFN